MNKPKLKTYAPQARRDFIEAVTHRAHFLGLAEHGIEPAELSGDTLLVAGRAWPKKIAAAREKLVARIQRDGFTQTMEAVAYTWFNRFAALRYMELHDYLSHGYRVLSNRVGGLPEILEHATSLDLPGLPQQQVIELKLVGDQDNTLYRLLLIAQCNALSSAMPFLFERIDDETELLLPDNLLHTDSIIAKLVGKIPEEDWQEIEIIGWLYQFYIIDEKARIDAKLKKGEVVLSSEIPAKTQLFTTNWIVKYLVQNSVGRLWMMTNSASTLKSQWAYYVEPAKQIPEVQAQLDAFIQFCMDESNGRLNPETITILDPACGSGHILVEAYDLLKQIYLEAGYRLRDIPRFILERNLYGLEIDERAAQLAGFALLMKAREDDRRILENPPRLNVLAIQDSKGLNLDDLTEHLKPFGIKRATLALLLETFTEAKTFGSLIQIPEALDLALPGLVNGLQQAAKFGDMFAQPMAAELIPLVWQASNLAMKYDVVIANPPYLGGKGMSMALKDYAKVTFPDSKSDLFAMFIERGFGWLGKSKQGISGKGQKEVGIGFNAMVTMQSWMFLSSYVEMREKLLNEYTIQTMAHLGARAFSEISGEVVQTTAFILQNKHFSGYKPAFFRLIEGQEEQKERALRSHQNRFDATVQDDFGKIPGSPVAYWVGTKLIESFDRTTSLQSLVRPRQGLATMDNDRFVRTWHETALNNTCLFDANENEDIIFKWFPYNKGGDFRRWFGNNEFIVNWENTGEEIKKLAIERYGSASKRVVNEPFYFKESVTWSKIGSGLPSFRYQPVGAVFDVAGMSLFPETTKQVHLILGFLNSNFATTCLSAISPTLNFEAGHIGSLPLCKLSEQTISDITSVVESAILLAKSDWNYFESSYEFSGIEWVSGNDKSSKLFDSWKTWVNRTEKAVNTLKNLEENNNRLFIEAYELQDELSPEVPEDQITLARADREKDCQRLISYAIGCMMGRYRLDRPGLIYAHAGNIDFDNIYNAVISKKVNSDQWSVISKEGSDCSSLTTKTSGQWSVISEENADDSTLTTNHCPLSTTSTTDHSPLSTNPFPADADGIIPVTDEHWFEDDAATRITEFLKAVWPETVVSDQCSVASKGDDDRSSLTTNHCPLTTNLKWLAESLGSKNNETPQETIRRYLSEKFFKDHLQTYKKRPIYWLFSSGKQGAFQALVYLHRYNESTLARMRNQYVIPLTGKIAGRIEFLEQEVANAASTSARTKAQKALDAMRKKQTELIAYDEQLRHYADMRISLDLDDGVKVNYGKFGNLLSEVKAVTGGSGDD